MRRDRVGCTVARSFAQALHRISQRLEGINEPEPPLFTEPGLCLARPDGTLYCASIQTMPFARPAFAEMLQAVAFITEKYYPVQGEA